MEPRVTDVSTMICGTWPAGHTTITVDANYEARAEAVLAVVEDANRWAAEVGIPPKPSVLDTTPVSDEDSAFCNGYRRVDGTRGQGGFCRVHGWYCPICGASIDGYDQAACAEKMSNWRPTGIR
jgi:hypothetical protein